MFPIWYQVCKVFGWTVSQTILPVQSRNSWGHVLPLKSNHLRAGRGCVVAFLWWFCCCSFATHICGGSMWWRCNCAVGGDSVFERDTWTVAVSSVSFLCFHWGWTKGDASDDEKNEGNIFLQRNPKFHSFKGQPISAITWNHSSEACGFHLDWMWNKS